MTNEERHAEPQDTRRTEGSDGTVGSVHRLAFTVQGPVTSEAADQHFHHHFNRNPPQQPDNPVRFKDSRANEQAEKLREKLREKQLSGAAESIPDSLLVPCQGHYAGPSRGSETLQRTDESSSEDAADEILQGLLSDITSLSVGSVTSDSAVITWDELDIEGCNYTVTVNTGKESVSYEDVETPHVLSGLTPATHYTASVSGSFGSIHGDPVSGYGFETLASEPARPGPPRPAGSTKTSLQIKWNAVAANGSPIKYYNVLWDKGTGDWVELLQCTDRQRKVSGLTPGTRFGFRISAVNEIGESLKSDIGHAWTGVGVPSPPSCIYLGHASETLLTICWSPPNDTGGATIEGYSVEQETEYGFIRVYNGEPQECTLTNLTRSTHYKFRVFSRNQAGMSKASGVVTFTTRAGLPPAPRNLRLLAKERPESVIVAWDPPRLEGEQQILRYNLNLTPLKENSVPEVLEFHTIDDSNMLIDGLDPGTLYRLLVSVVTAGGEGPFSSPFIFKTRPVNPSAPAPPTLRTKPAPYSLNLQWATPHYTGGSPILKYTLEMVKEEWSQIYTGPETAFLVPDLNPGKSYRFRLRAHNAAGGSLYSNMGNFTTSAAPPNPPPAPTFTSKGPYAATISWKESETNGTPVTGYSVDLCIAGGSFKEVARVVQLECVVRDLLPGSSYFCVVRADSSAGESAPSQAYVYTTSPAPPQPPTQLHLVDNTESTITVDWEESYSPGSDILHYNVCFNGELHQCYQTVFSTEGLSHDTAYKIRIQAVNSVGPGPFSAVKTVSTGTPLPAPITGSIVLSGKGHNFLKISWNTTRAVKGYRVERRTVGEEHSGHWTEVFQGTKNNLKIGKLTASTSYEVRVCGVNNAGSGAWLTGTFCTDPIPPTSILKLSCAVKGNQGEVTWVPKDKLDPAETYQLFQATDSDDFSQVYEGASREYTWSASPERAYSFKVRVVRVSSASPLLGPFSLIAVVKRPKVVSAPKVTDKQKQDDGPVVAGNYSDYTEETQFILLILVALCLPAGLAIFYFLYF